MELDVLIDRAKKNDREAQAELFKKYKDTLYFISLKYCRNQEDAEDNLQDAFVTIFSSIRKYKGRGSFEGWMKRITIYKAIDRYKNQKEVPVPEVRVSEGGSTEIEDSIEAIPLGILLQHIQELPDQYRMVFNLYQMDNHSHKEIANLLSISESTSKSNYHRAKLILRERLAPKTKNLSITKP
ncbi:sigma-70 family RNA polymerase sigma factor [Aureisphaera galaxeae]|uniref:RNA polymerase sigma factor n=1 Tax=Aureisphaera galaxeae TaxID=1538023 RepID=UPI0023510035|nr:sigma-70 family RNA polymerase sigma factor [Aureisphaera galaxeae]MDC8003240.1 sigma-70 family RNA polymerase sigma factor [Aureisphaera galaxeae]